VDSKRKKGKYKVQDTMYRIFCSNYQNGKKYGQKRDKVKCIHGLTVIKPLPPQK
jgi:hypothetical protein